MRWEEPDHTLHQTVGILQRRGLPSMKSSCELTTHQNEHQFDSSRDWCEFSKIKVVFTLPCSQSFTECSHYNNDLIFRIPKTFLRESANLLECSHHSLFACSFTEDVVFANRECLSFVAAGLKFLSWKNILIRFVCVGEKWLRSASPG